MSRAQEIADLLSGVTITTADNTAQLTLSSTDADANSGPVLLLQRDSGSPADGDNAGLIQFKFDNSAGSDFVSAAQISAKANDVTDGTEDGELELLTIVAGSSRSRIEMLPGEVVINEDSIDSDFRVESNGNANMLFVDAGNDKVGIGTNSPANKLSVVGGDFGTLLLDNADASHGTQILFQHNSTTNTGCDIQMSDAGGMKIRTLAVEPITLATSASAGSPANVLVLGTNKDVTVSDGDLVIGTSGHGIDFSAAGNVSGMTSELLDDYEEGTFTPSFTGGLSGSGYGDQNGVYTKIGNFVFFVIELDITNGAASTDGNQIKIDNLPFSSDQNSTMNHQMGGAWVTFNNNFYNVDTGIYMQIGENTNQVKLFKGDGNALVGNATGVNGQNDFHIAGCYRTAT